MLKVGMIVSLKTKALHTPNHHRIPERSHNIIASLSFYLSSTQVPEPITEDVYWPSNTTSMS